MRLLPEEMRKRGEETTRATARGRPRPEPGAGDGFRAGSFSDVVGRDAVGATDAEERRGAASNTAKAEAIAAAAEDLGKDAPRVMYSDVSASERLQVLAHFLRELPSRSLLSWS